MAQPLSLVYFAWVRERLGRDGDHITLPAEVTKISELMTYLIEKDGNFSAVFDEPAKIRFALDQQFVDIDASIGEARELAIFPPVTGG